jgi:serine/threonine protein kinase
MASCCNDSLFTRTARLSPAQVDVYSLGNIFYTLLQHELPFHDIETEKVYKLVKRGKRPSLYADIWNSTDPVDMALKEAMLMCHDQDPKQRSTAREVEIFLRRKMQELDPDRLAEWPRS